jgi:2-aminoethylphosphonate-pyruvate transaminase
MILLNPGPVNVSDRVRNALLGPDICHRESECAELIGDIRRKLLQAFVPGAESEYTAILLTGSGTAAVEASIMSSLPPGKRLIHVNNGVYGERISSIIATQRLGIVEIKYKWDTVPDPEAILKALKQQPSAHGVVMVHHETTLGLLNPVHEIADHVDSRGGVFIVDAVSGLGGETLDIAGRHMYMVAGTAGKCIQGFPGVSFVLVRKGFMENVLKYPKRTWYLNLANYYTAQENGTVPFTPAVQVYAAFNEALSELLEEGVAARIQRYGRMAALIRERMAALGVRAVLAPEHQSNSLTAFHLPEGLILRHGSERAYDVLHDGLKERGFVIYAGQGHLESQIFRVANMGALQDAAVEGFLGAFEEVVTHANRVA